MLAELAPPDFPLPIGVIRRVERPTFDASVRSQIDEITKDQGAGDLQRVLHSGQTWTVK